MKDKRGKEVKTGNKLWLRILLIILALDFSSVFISADCKAQENASLDSGIATSPAQPKPISSPLKIPTQVRSSAPVTKNDEVNSTYTQNADSIRLENSVSNFNERYCPPQKPITEISDFALIRLVHARLISRAELQKYRGMVLINGKVYLKNATQTATKTANMPALPGKSFFWEFEKVCELLEVKTTRGKSKGNQKSEPILELKQRKITYRDSDNNLCEMEIYSPPPFPTQQQEITGAGGKKVKDYATSVLMPNGQSNSKDVTAFDDMPSATHGWKAMTTIRRSRIKT